MEYRFLIKNSRLPDINVATIMESRDTIFFESEFLIKNTPNTYCHKSILLKMHGLVIHTNIKNHVEI